MGRGDVGRAVGSPPRAWRRFQGVRALQRGGRFTSTRVETLVGKTVTRTGKGGSPPRAWRRLLLNLPIVFASRFTSTRVETLS